MPILKELDSEKSSHLELFPPLFVPFVAKPNRGAKNVLFMTEMDANEPSHC